MRIYTTLTGMLLGLVTVGVANGNENNHPFNYNEGNTERRLLGQKGFDIVFMVDESGSMSSEQASLKSQVSTIFDATNALAPVLPSKFGLVGFGGLNIFHPSDGHVHIPLTTNQTAFLEAANNLTLDGGQEPSCEFICKAIEGDLDPILGFRNNTTFGIVLISDEPSNFDDPAYNMTRIINSMNNIPPNEANARGVFYGILPLGTATDSYDPLAAATGGRLYNSADFNADPAGVLKDIITRLNAAVNPLVTIDLVPKSAICATGIPNQLIATVIIGTDPIAGINVTFRVISGPNSGDIGANVTNATGKATWTFTNNGVAGNCTYKACIIYEGVEQCTFESGAATVDPLTATCINCNSPNTSTPFTTETTITATTADRCGPLTVSVTGEDCFRLAHGGLRKYKTRTCVAKLEGPSIVIGANCQVGDHVEWPVQAVNAAGQSATQMCYITFTGARRLRGTS